MAHYFGSNPVKIIRRSRNLIPFPYYAFLRENATSYTTNGITFTLLNDGGVYAKGTSTDYAYCKLINNGVLDLGKSPIYAYEGQLKGTNGMYCLSKSGSEAYNLILSYDAGNKSTWLRVAPNRTVDGVIYPMLNEGDTALPYEPYNQLWRVRSGALIRNPKNLFNETEFAKLSDVSIDTYNGKNCYRFTPKGSEHRIPFFAKAGETVTFSFEIAYPKGLDMYIVAESADPANGTMIWGMTTNDVKNNFVKFQRTVKLATDCVCLNLRTYAIYSHGSHYLKNIMLNEGTTAEPYFIQD